VRFFFVRHGQTDYNAQGWVQGHIDIPLNELGRWQAEQVGERLKSYEIGGIISSDLARASETARAIAAHHSAQTLLTTELLREINYGAFEGMQFPEIESTYPEEYLQWREGEIDYTPPGAESIYEQRARARKALMWVQDHCPDCDVAVVAHGGILRSLIANLLDLGIEQQNRLHFDNTSLSVVTKTPRGMALMLLNDSSHLKDRSPYP
jgi:broad specificity phosphatase PhoE